LGVCGRRGSSHRHQAQCCGQGHETRGKPPYSTISGHHCLSPTPNIGCLNRAGQGTPIDLWPGAYDIRMVPRAAVLARAATGKANTRKTVHSIAANHALDGKPLMLRKVGDAWQISEL